MKKILLLGDSIRMGYDEYVQTAFDGIAEVYYPEDNCRFSTYLLRNFYVWKNSLLGRGELGTADLVHWNVGLWDCLIQLDGEPLVELEQYKKYLLRIHKQISCFLPGAKQIFATSTAVVEHRFGKFKRFNHTIEEYNQAAREVLEPLGVEFNDLYELTKNFPEEWHSDATHFNTKEGQKALTGQVVAHLEKALELTAKPLDFNKLFTEETNIIGI